MSSCSESEPYALQVLDDSMEPEFPDRCVVVIDPFPECQDGAFVFAEYEGVRWFRQYQKRGEQHFLVPLNPIYPEFEMTGPFTVYGLIVQRNVRRKIKHYPMGLLPEDAENEISARSV